MPLEAALLLLQQLKGPALSCLIALAFAGHPVTVSWLKSVTGYGPHSVARAMTHLQELGLATCNDRRSAWQLADSAHQFLRLPTAQPDPYRENRANREYRGMSLEEVNLTELKEDQLTSTDSDSSPDRENCTAPASLADASVDQILAATSLLFGERVLGPADRYPDTLLLLAWIAEAWTMRHKLRNPARVVYSNLKNHRPPDPRFLNASLASLPVEFLTAAGLSHLCPPPPERCSVAPEPQPDPDPAPEDPDDPEPDPSLSLPANLRGTLTAQQAWDQLLDALENLIPRSTFRTWVGPAQLVRFDPLTWTFTVEVPTPQLKALWDDRLVLTVRRQLIGVCGRPAGILVACPGPP